MLYLVEIPRELEVEPELRLHAEEALKSERRVRCHAALAMYELVDTWIRNP
jgi:hypothetical protein